MMHTISASESATSLVSTILLVDDDVAAVTSLARAMPAFIKNCNIKVATSQPQVAEWLPENSPQVAVIDLCLNPAEGVESGFALLKMLLGHDASMRVIVLTGHGDTSYGVRAMQLGATNFLHKPADLPHLSALVSAGFEQYALLTQVAAQETFVANREIDQELAGGSRALVELKEQIRFFSSTNQPVLIEGETGVGKSVCARLIHRLSKRSAHQFVRYQPGLSRSDILASELFGHQKGAFTGAEDSREGLLIRAHRGTFFLDEIDGLPLETQTTLLGVLQEKRFRRLGADEESQVDVRFLSATNADVDKLKGDGLLRSDFFHRIAHSRVRIPSLRERIEDVPALARSILKRLQADEEVGFVEFSDNALDMLMQYPWPGNIRELESIVQGASARAVFAGRTEVLSKDISFSSSPLVSELDSLPLQSRVLNYKRQCVQDALLKFQGNQVQAAKSLGIDRTTLRRILQGDGGKF